MPKLPEKIEDWTPPWEKKNEDFNAETAKELIFNLHKDVERKDDDVKTARSERKAAEQERDDAKAQLEAKTDGDNSDLAKLQRANASLQKKLDDAAETERDRKALALEVAMDVEDITVKQARALAPRLSGSTREELEADAEAVVSELGFHVGPEKASTKDDDGDGDDDGQAGLRRREARSRFDRNGDDTPLPEATLEKVNELFPL